MNLHKVIVRPGIRTSERFARLNFFERDLFYGLLSVANTKAGWFENNATVLRAALFAPCLGKVSERDVKAGLLRLQEGRLIKLWTGKNGRAYGQINNYGQSFDYGDPLPPDAHPPDEDELQLGQPDPPRSVPELKRDELKGGGKAREARRPKAPPPPHELQEDWLARLATEWPGVNVLAELEAAKKKRGRVEREWFEKHWLPNVSATVDFKAGGTGRANAPEPEPEAWRVLLKDRHANESWAETAASYAWAEMPANFRARILRELPTRV